MTPLRQQMIAALQLSGKSERTQQSYVREVRLLAQFYHTSPDRLSEQEPQRYFLHRKNIDGLASASMRICYSGMPLFLSACPPTRLAYPLTHACANRTPSPRRPQCGGG